MHERGRIRWRIRQWHATLHCRMLCMPCVCQQQSLCTGPRDTLSSTQQYSAAAAGLMARAHHVGGGVNQHSVDDQRICCRLRLCVPSCRHVCKRENRPTRLWMSHSTAHATACQGTRQRWLPLSATAHLAACPAPPPAPSPGGASPMRPALCGHPGLAAALPGEIAAPPHTWPPAARAARRASRSRCITGKQAQQKISVLECPTAMSQTSSPMQHKQEPSTPAHRTPSPHCLPGANQQLRECHVIQHGQRRG